MSDEFLDKDTQGSFKAPLHVVPPSLVIKASGPLSQGAAKYGSFNWRTKPVRLSGHLEAVHRHLAAYYDGEEAASDSGYSHLDHAVAGLAVILDAQECGTLIDDRPPKGPAAKILKDKELFKIADPADALPLSPADFMPVPDWPESETTDRIVIKDNG